MDQPDSKNPRRYPEHPHVGVGGLVIINESLLLIHRKYEPNAGCWSIPGGHVDVGESIEAAIEREILEETGLKTKADKVAAVLNKIMRDKEGNIEYHYVLVDFFMKLDSSNEDTNYPHVQAASDALDAKFVPFSELNDYKITETLCELLKRLNLI